MHDLLRLYARQLSDARCRCGRAGAGRDRLLDYYLHSAGAADASSAGAARHAGASGFADRADALAWLDAERPSLIAAVTMAANTGRDQIAMRLPLQSGRVPGLAAAFR